MALRKDTFTAVSSFHIGAALRLLEGVNAFSVFGIREVLTSDAFNDVTNLPDLVIPLPDLAGEALEVVSDDPTDTDPLQVQALGPDATALEPFIVELNGTTPVPLPSPISRINDVLSEGVNGFNGNIDFRQPGGGGTTFLRMDPNAQCTSQALYTVPAGKRWLIFNMAGSLRKSGGGAHLLVDLLHKRVDQAKYFRPYGFGLQHDGTSAFTDENFFPQAQDGPADIKIRVYPDASGASVAGRLNGLLFG